MGKNHNGLGNPIEHESVLSDYNEPDSQITMASVVLEKICMHTAFFNP